MPAFKKTNAMRMLDKAGIDYEYKESPGTHNWDYWDQCIKYALEFFNIENQ